MRPARVHSMPLMALTSFGEKKGREESQDTTRRAASYQNAIRVSMTTRISASVREPFGGAASWRAARRLDAAFSLGAAPGRAFSLTPGRTRRLVELTTMARFSQDRARYFRGQLSLYCWGGEKDSSPTPRVLSPSMIGRSEGPSSPAGHCHPASRMRST